MQVKIDTYNYFRFTIDRIGYTITAPTFFILGKEHCRCPEHPKAITAYIEKRARELQRKGYKVEFGREPLKGKKGRGIKACYVTWKDKVHGEVTFRIRNWKPFIILVYLNGNRALQRYCDWKGIEYRVPENIDNTFLYLGLTNDESMNVLLYVLDPRKVYDRLIKPRLEMMFP